MGTQFIERNQLVIGIIAAILTVVTTFAALLVTRDDLQGGYRITAQFVDANGLRPGDAAIIAGIPAGRVIEIDIVEDRVEALVQIDGGVDLPTSTRAEITLRTLVGKRAIALDTGNVFTDLMGEGDVIPLERTSVTIDVPELAETADDVLGELDSEALNLLLVSVADVTRDQRQQVAGLIDSGTDLTELVNDQEQQIRQLLRNLSRLSQTLESRDEELVGIIDDLDVALGALAARRGDLQALLRETQTAGTVTADFIRDVRADLDAILDELHLDLEIVARHQMDLAEGLAYVGDSLVGYGSIGFAQGQPVPWGHVFVTAAGPVGVDLILGCGGIVDAQLDALLGPDPRSCAEQDGDSFPDDVEPPSGPLAPGTGLIGGLLSPPQIPVPEDGTLQRSPQRLPIDVTPRSLLHALGTLGGEQ
jgi:phospholipid/cholesterol/gamma-HCH transport system substrate-binding protein